MKKKLLLIFIILLTFITTGCTNNKETSIKEDLLDINYQTGTNETTLSQYESNNPIVAMYIENYGSIVIELYPDIAPNTVNNFISLIKSGFYDNNTFHRLVPDFVLQGGDPTGTGTGGPGYNINGEFSENNFENNLKHEKGIISMARSQDYNSAGSQFFIMLEDASYLDGSYAAFGKVIDGWKNIENIEKREGIQDEGTGKLQKNIIIKKTLVDLKGKEYKEVEKIEEVH